MNENLALKIKSIIEKHEKVEDDYAESLIHTHIDDMDDVWGGSIHGKRDEKLYYKAYVDADYFNLYIYDKQLTCIGIVKASQDDMQILGNMNIIAGLEDTLPERAVDRLKYRTHRMLDETRNLVHYDFNKEEIRKLGKDYDNKMTDMFDVDKCRKALKEISAKLEEIKKNDLAILDLSATYKSVEFKDYTSITKLVQISNKYAKYIDTKMSTSEALSIKYSMLEELDKLRK